MSDSLVQLSARGAFSYHWNKGIDNGESCFIKTVKSAVGFFKGLFGGYTVSVAEIKAIFNDNNHGNSICYKEYCIKLKNRNAEIAGVSVKKPSIDKLVKLMKKDNFKSSGRPYHYPTYHCRQHSADFPIYLKNHKPQRNTEHLPYYSLQDSRTPDHILFLIANGTR
jgi:hypothetical protein